MKRKIWKSLIAVGCAASLFMTAPGVTVFAEEIPTSDEERALSFESIEAETDKSLSVNQYYDTSTDEEIIENEDDIISPIDNNEIDLEEEVINESSENDFDDSYVSDTDEDIFITSEPEVQESLVSASSNLYICGVDIGIAPGSYMQFKNKDGSNSNSGYYYNGYYLASSQCFGFARWCQYKLFGYHSASSGNDFYKVSANGISSIARGSLTTSNLKSMIQASKIGAHLRTNANSSGTAHSMVITGISDTGFSIAQCNGSNNNEYSGYKQNYVGTYTYTWQSYVDSTYGARGIAYIELPAYYPYPDDFVPEPPDKPYINNLEPVYTNTNTINVQWTAVDRATSYYIDVWKYGDPSEHVFSADVGNTTSYTLNCFGSDGKYGVCVSALNSAGITYGDYSYTYVLYVADLGENFVADIVLGSSDKAVSIAGNNNVELQTMCGGYNQSWEFQRQPNRSYKIIATNFTGRCLDDDNLGGSGSNVAAVEDNGLSAQRWFIREASGYYILTPLCAPECSLDAVNGGTSDGTNIHIYSTNYGSAQMFSIRKIDAPNKAPVFSLDKTSLVKSDKVKATWSAVENARSYYIDVRRGDDHVLSVDVGNVTSYTMDCFPENGQYGICVSARNPAGIKYGEYQYVEVGPSSISEATVTGISNKTYSGSAQTQNPTVTLGGKTLANGTDYSLSYSNNVNAGTATVTITGKNDYTGSVSKNFTISPLSLANATVTGLSNKTYTGSAQTQNPTVKVNDRTLTKDTDYTLSYSNNTNAGTSTVTITGKGNYTGTISKTFTISTLSIANATVTGIANKTYSGSAQIQNPAIKVEDKTLTSGIDYTIGYSNNVNVGTATVTMTGKGNYSGSISKTFTISALSIANATVTGIANKTYSGSAQTQNPTVKVGDKTLTSGTDYTVGYSNNVNAGTATVTMNGKGNYTGSVSKTFTISALSGSGATVTGISNKTYNGSAQTQNPTVKVNDRTLVSGTDYTLSYSNNTNAGTAKVTITFKGNYTGSVSKNFTINQASPTLTFASTSVTKTTLDAAFTNVLTKKTDGTVTFKSSNTNVAIVDSDGKVTIKGEGAATITASAAAGTNYKAGSASYDLTVVDGRQNISGYAVTLSPASYTYNGSACKPTITVKNGSFTLTSGTDYTVSYSNNTNVGTGKVTITGKGNYTGTINKTFTINQASPTLTFASAGVTKTTLDEAFTNTLTKKTDGTVTFKSGDTGVATVDSASGLVTIKGEGTTTITATATAGTNYKAGSASYTLTVVDGRIDISTCTVTLSTTTYTYNGSAKKPTVTVKNGSTVLISGTDYTVAYKNNTNAGTATVTITGKGNYKGTASKTFTINKAAASLKFASASIEKTTLDAAFTNELTKTTDGTVTFKSSDTGVATVDSASGLVTIKGEGTTTITAAATAGTNYKAGSASYTLTVVDGRIDISTCTVTLSSTSYTYNGSAKKPTVTVKNGSTTLTSGTDYTVAYKNNTNAGTATVTITGKGIYKGTVSKTFTINKAAASLKFASASVEKTTLDAAFTNELTKTTDGTVIFKSGDTGVATVDSTSGLVTIKGEGTTTITATATAGTNYKAGSASYTLTVVDGRIDISTCTVTLSATSYTYNGSAKKPTVTVKNGSTTLTSGTDYTVSYKNNTNAGTATVTVTGKGNYTGSVSKKFTIKKATPSLKFAENAVSKSTLDEAFTNELTKTTDGTVTFTSNDTGIASVDSESGLVTIKGAGTAVITATAVAGKNYNAGNASYALTVTPVSIEKASVAGVSLSYGYSGKAYTPTMTVKVNGVTLTEGTDYTVKIENNKNPGTATITLTGKGKYTGTRIKTFEIVDCVSSLVSGKTYQLIPKNNSSTAVCAYSGKMLKNTKVYITDRSASEAMRFKAIQNSDGTWKFINAKCEMALAVQQNSSALGAGIVLYDQTTKKAQNWNLSKKSDNSWAIMNAVTGYSIAMSDESAVKGTTLSMAETQSNGLQRFYIAETDPVDASFDGTYFIRAGKDKNFVVNIAGASKEDGANVNLNSYSNTNSKKFKAIYSGAGYYRLVNVNSGMVLSVEGNTKKDGTNVIQSTWAAQSGQRWKFTKNSDGTVTLTNALGTILHLSGNKTSSGTNIVAKNASTSTAQKWYLQ